MNQKYRVPNRKIVTSISKNIVPTKVCFSRGISSIKYTNDTDILIVLIAPSPNIMPMRILMLVTKNRPTYRHELTNKPAIITRFLPWRSEILGIQSRVLTHPRKNAEPIRATFQSGTQISWSYSYQLFNDLLDDQSISYVSTFPLQISAGVHIYFPGPFLNVHS